MIYAYSQQICSEHPPLGAQNMYGESGEWQSWQSVLQELTRQQERPLAPPPTLGEFFMLPRVPFYPVNGMGIDLVQVPKCPGYGAGEWGGKEQSGLTMHCSQWSSVICQSGPWTYLWTQTPLSLSYCPGGVGAAAGHMLVHLGFGLGRLFKASIRTFLGGSCALLLTPVCPGLQWVHSETCASLLSFTSA